MARSLYRLERVRYEAAYRSAAARLANARRLVERLEPLLARRAVAQQDVDNARTEFEAAQGAYDEAQKDRNDAVVRAEIDGRIGRTQLEVGARVTGPADLLTTIEQVNPVYVTFRPSAQDQQDWRSDERSRRLVQPGSDLEVKVVLPNGTEAPRGGRLDYVSPSVDPGTGTLELRASFDNRDRSLVAGQFVRVRLHGFERDSALAVPRRAVQQSLDRQFVLVVGKGDTAQARNVETGTWSGDWWIIESGLQAGERVVVEGVQKAAPGQPVRPVMLSAGIAPSRIAPSRIARREARSECDPGERRQAALLLHPAADLRGRDLHRDRAAGRVRALIGLPISALSADHASVGAGDRRSIPAPPRRTWPQAVAAPIEQQLSGLDGLLYFTSSNASDGTMNLQVYFDISRDQDLAAVDVQKPGQAGRAAAAARRCVRQGDHDHEGADRHPRGASALSSKDPRYDATYLEQLRQDLRRWTSSSGSPGWATRSGFGCSSSRC